MLALSADEVHRRLGSPGKMAGIPILSLIHFCEEDGPSQIMTTEGLVMPCDVCPDACESGSGSSLCHGDTRTHSPTTPSSSLGKETLQRQLQIPDLSPGSQARAPIHTARQTRYTHDINPNAKPGTLANAAQSKSPPNHGGKSSSAPSSNGYLHRRGSSFRNTYSGNDEKRKRPCDDCAMMLPRSTVDAAALPILRTKQVYRRVSVSSWDERSPSRSTPSMSMSSYSGDSEGVLGPLELDDDDGVHWTRGSTNMSRESSCSSYTSTTGHAHYLEYRSTKAPLEPTFTMVHDSCIRTFSGETMPPALTTMTSAPTSPFVNSYLSTSNTTSANGPIFFGEPLSGYTTAYTFRIHDPTARGCRRRYAIMAVSTQQERVAVQTFTMLSVAFRNLATWIQGLVDQENEKLEQAIQSPRSGDDERSFAFGAPPTAFASRDSRSSFPSGGNRSSDGRMAGLSPPRQRSLPELVGLPDFFYQLHVRFVTLLAELGVLLDT